MSKLGPVTGPVPTGGGPPPNKPGGVMPTTGKPGPAAPHPLSPGAPQSGGAPAGVLSQVSAPHIVQGANNQPLVALPGQVPQGNVAHAQILPGPSVPQGAGRLGVVPPGNFRPGVAPTDPQGIVPPYLANAWNERKKLWKEVGQVVVSSVLSIHNRSKLFKRALYGYLWQTMPAESWEILLIDDLSTEDLSKTYEPLVGQINLRHIKFDHTRHPLFKAKNPGWKPGMKKNWYHTPALTINLGLHLARGPIISLCHPEILHAPENFELAAVRILNEDGVYLFGTTYLGTQDTNRWLDKNPSWINFGWKGFLGRIAAQTCEKYTNEKYWYTSFLPRKAGREIGGVDFEYLNGVAGEDDDFRDRVDRAGYATIWAPEIEGFHQDHSDEGEAHRVRTTDDWKRGLAHNRALYQERKKINHYPSPANKSTDWTARECFVEERRFTVGKREAEIITRI